MRYYLLMMLLMTALNVYAQDSNYWTQQFGNRSALLSGAVMGESTDNSMVFYNPGALGFLTNTSVSVNANLYRMENIKILNALGQQADFKSRQFAAVPLVAGGLLKTKSGPWKIGYAFLNPMNFHFKGIARVDGEYAIVDDAESPGTEELVGELSLTSTQNEMVFAFGTGRVLNENWGIGVTHLIAMHSQTYQRNFSAHIFLNDASQTIVDGSQVQNVDYFNLRYSAKVGITYKPSAWSWGLTITSPSVRIIGNGTIAADVTAHNLKLDGTERQDGVASDRQAKLKSTYKTPMSVALGVNFTGDHSTWGLVAEYFGNIKKYEILQARPSTFIRPASLQSEIGSDELLRVNTANRQVFNLALGYELRLSEKFSYLLSWRNDMSYNDGDVAKERGIKTNICSWDVFHFNMGTTITTEKSILSLGVLFSFGKTNTYNQEGNINQPSENNILFGTTTITEANYQSIGFLLGYTFNFKN